ncbi:MAG: SapC family protein [Pseudomonadales bacterium]|nr:SapC family protein [Pseudomonadales bacterium]MCB1669395.1 SapC family protein [Pseudomonadales bacterium]MCP5344550.1 SapC family protein [Pseudomonadales bacterium]
MSSPVPLQNDRHAKLKVVESSDFRRYKNNHLVSVVIQDFFTLAVEFPLVFVKINKSEDFIPVAMMGLRDGMNLYCQTEEWQASVAPMNFNNAPFAIARLDETSDQLVVLVDEESPLLNEKDGEPLFDEAGKRSEYFEKRIENLVKVAEQTRNTQEMCKRLVEKNLLTTQQIQLQHRPDGTRYNIDGVYIVDEIALNNLSDADYLHLRSMGLLPVIYSHLASLQQLRRLSERQYNADKAAAAAEAEEKTA